MKKALKILGVLCLTLVVFACSKNDDPVDNDLFVGTYKGSIGFKEGDKEPIDVKEGSCYCSKNRKYVLF